MPNVLSRSRSIAHAYQGGRCCYCEAPTWINAPNEFASKYRLTPGETRLLQATAEHLVARCNGGGNAHANIACACLACNSRRHRRKNPLEPEVYKRRVKNRIEKGLWHSPRIIRLIRDNFTGPTHGVVAVLPSSHRQTQQSSSNAGVTAY